MKRWSNLEVALDFDGTCVRTMDLICHMVNFKRGTNFTARDIKSWDFWQQAGYDEDFWGVYDMFDTTDLRQTLAPYDRWTGYMIAAMAARCKRVDLVTCNRPEAGPSIRAWLDKYVPDRFSDLVSVRCLGRVTPDEKVSLGYNVYLDDGPHLAVAVEREPGVYMGLANARWNEHVVESDRVRRWRSSSDLIRLLDVYSDIIGGKHRGK